MRRVINIVVMALMLSGTAYADDWLKAYPYGKYDKGFFASVCVLQVVDGLTTMSHLGKDENNYISDTWNWKYGTERPSAGHMWTVKAAELIGCYYVAKYLPPKIRKVFFIGVDSLLIYCIQNNLKMGAGIRINF